MRLIVHSWPRKWQLAKQSFRRLFNNCSGAFDHITWSSIDNRVLTLLTVAHCLHLHLSFIQLMFRPSNILKIYTSWRLNLEHVIDNWVNSYCWGSPRTASIGSCGDIDVPKVSVSSCWNLFNDINATQPQNN